VGTLKRKKLISLVIIILLTFWAQTAAFAEEDMEISAVVEKAEVLIDEEFYVDIYLQGITDLYGISLDLVFDPNIIELIPQPDSSPNEGAAQLGTLFAQRLVSDGLELNNEYSNGPTTGFAREIFLLTGDAPAINIDSSTLFARLNFKAIAPGEVYFNLAPGDGSVNVNNFNTGGNTMLINLAGKEMDANNSQRISYGISELTNSSVQVLESLDSPAGDFNQNGELDYGDIVLFKEAWGKDTANQYGDFDIGVTDGVIDYQDLMLLTELWNSFHS